MTWGTLSKAPLVPPQETAIRKMAVIIVSAAAIQANTILIHSIQLHTDNTHNTFIYIQYRHIHTMVNQQKTIYLTSSGILTHGMKPFKNTCTSTYRVCTSTCQYKNPVLTCTVYVRVQDSCTGMYMVCTWQYFTMQVCISMYLTRTGHFFRGMMQSPSLEMLQSTFHGT